MFEQPKSGSPVAVPVAEAPGGDVATALAQIGQSLLTIASAIAGKPAPSLRTYVDTSETVFSAINLFLISKKRAGKSDRYVRSMKNSLSKFARGRGQLPLGAVSLADVEKWIQHNQWNSTTRRGYLRDVRTFYNFCVARNLTGHNPARGVELPERAPCVIGIHSPGEVATVLEAARRHDLNLCRALAIRYFAGLRSAECDRLTEAHIKTEHGVIEVTAQNAKTRARRLVTIQPNLAEWLKLGGALPLHDVNNRMRLFTAQLRQLDSTALASKGVPWLHNVTRHSFCSYHLAQFESAAKTALEAGNSEEMLFRHYRALVTKSDAAAFWNIVPRH